MAQLHDIADGAIVSTGQFEYIADLQEYAYEKPYYFSGPIPEEQEHLRSNIKYVRHNVSLRDLRGREQDLKLEQHGFEFPRLPTKLSLTIEENCMDESHAYMEEVAQWLKERLAAEMVLCYAYRVSIIPNPGRALLTISVSKSRTVRPLGRWRPSSGIHREARQCSWESTHR